MPVHGSLVRVVPVHPLLVTAPLAALPEARLTTCKPRGHTLYMFTICVCYKVMWHVHAIPILLCIGHLRSAACCLRHMDLNSEVSNIMPCSTRENRHYMPSTHLRTTTDAARHRKQKNQWAAPAALPAPRASVLPHALHCEVTGCSVEQKPAGGKIRYR